MANERNFEPGNLYLYSHNGNGWVFGAVEKLGPNGTIICSVDAQYSTKGEKLKFQPRIPI